MVRKRRRQIKDAGYTSAPDRNRPDPFRKEEYKHGTDPFREKSTRKGALTMRTSFLLRCFPILRDER
jgi:hypothetical protein